MSEADTITVDEKTGSVVKEMAEQRGVGPRELLQEAVALVKFLGDQEQNGARLVIVESDGTQHRLVVTPATSEDD